jgi:DUF917 family protein
VAAHGNDRLAAMIDALGATLLIRGTVLEVERAAGEGFSRGAATVQAAGAGAGARRRLRLELQNEFLVALEDGAPRAMVPDLISVVAADSYAPILTERLRYGQRVAVLASPAPAVWRTDEALALIGPAAFGYDLEYTQMAAAERHAGA